MARNGEGFVRGTRSSHKNRPIKVGDRFGRVRNGVQGIVQVTEIRRIEHRISAPDHPTFHYAGYWEPDAR